MGKKIKASQNTAKKLDTEKKRQELKIQYAELQLQREAMFAAFQQQQQQLQNQANKQIAEINNQMNGLKAQLADLDRQAKNG